jgi:hypothetical protein
MGADAFVGGASDGQVGVATQTHLFTQSFSGLKASFFMEMVFNKSADVTLVSSGMAAFSPHFILRKGTVSCT